MSVYAAADEERIRLQASVKDWTASGLLSTEQGSRFAAETRTELRRTNSILRAVLAFFTALVTAGTIGFTFAVSGIRGDSASAIVLLVSAVLCWWAAESLVRWFRLYRYGVEESLIAGGVFMLAAGLVLIITGDNGATWRTGWSLGLLAGAIAAAAAYARFGFVYAGVAAMAFAGSITFTVDVASWLQRVGAALILSIAFALTRRLSRTHADDHRGDDYRQLQAAALAGVYLALNLRIADVFGVGTTASSFPPLFYWATYAMTGLVPIAGLALGIREKARPLIDISVVLGIISLATSKPYLGWPRQSWDPVVFGALTMAAAVLIRRWLASGSNGERAGYTAERILASDRRLLGALGTFSVAVPTPAHTTPPDQAPSGFDGGRSGGAGASAGY